MYLVWKWSCHPQASEAILIILINSISSSENENLLYIHYAKELLGLYITMKESFWIRVNVQNITDSDLLFSLRLLGGPDGKETAWNAGDLGSIPGLGRSPGVGNSKPLQYSCLENSMYSGAWWTTVHGVTKSWKWVSDKDFTSLLVFMVPELERHSFFTCLVNPLEYHFLFILKTAFILSLSDMMLVAPTVSREQMVYFFPTSATSAMVNRRKRAH